MCCSIAQQPCSTSQIRTRMNPGIRAPCPCESQDARRKTSIDSILPVGESEALSIQKTQPLVEAAVSVAPASIFAARAAVDGSSYALPLYLIPSAVTSARGLVWRYDAQSCSPRGSRTPREVLKCDGVGRSVPTAKGMVPGGCVSSIKSRMRFSTISGVSSSGRAEYCWIRSSVAALTGI